MEYIQVKPEEPDEDLEGRVAVDEEAPAEVEEAGPEVGDPKTLSLIARKSATPPRVIIKVQSCQRRGSGRAVKDQAEVELSEGMFVCVFVKILLLPHASNSFRLFLS